MFEESNSGKRHLRTRRNERNNRLGVWNPAYLLRVEHANESTNQNHRDFDPLSWILVGFPSPRKRLQH